jgi:transcriptional regulator with XRE-family HTH domain
MDILSITTLKLSIAVSVIRMMGCHRGMITGPQIRAARGLLGWTQQQLADASIIAVNTIKQLEHGTTDAKTSTLSAVQRALEAAGIEFIPAAGGRGEGVRRVSG